MLIPDKLLVDRDLFDWVLFTKLKLDRDEYSPDVLHEKLQAEFLDLNVPFLDLLPFLRVRHDEGFKLYHNDDGHWDTAGHQEAADRLYDFLKSKEWL